MRHTFPPGLFLGFDHETRILYSGRKHRRCGMTEQTAGSRFRLGVSAAEDWRMAVDGCLLQLMPLSDAAHIGFVYISDRLADKLPKIVRLLSAATGLANHGRTSFRERRCQYV